MTKCAKVRLRDKDDSVLKRDTDDSVLKGTKMTVC